MKLLRLLPLLLLAGCQHARPPVPQGMSQIKDHGRLLSIDQTLGMGTLNLHGKTVSFWWNNQIQRPGTMGDPEVKTSQIPFDAKVGETVYFQGLVIRGEIFMTKAYSIN